MNPTKTTAGIILFLLVACHGSFAQTAQSNTASRNQQPVEKKEEPEKRGLGWIHLLDFQIPATLLKALESNPDFKGWKSNGVFYSPYGDRYSIDVKKEDTVFTYFLDVQGEPLQKK